MTIRISLNGSYVTDEAALRAAKVARVLAGDSASYAVELREKPNPDPTAEDTGCVRISVEA